MIFFLFIFLLYIVRQWCVLAMAYCLIRISSSFSSLGDLLVGYDGDSSLSILPSVHFGPDAMPP
jgi:hypothetical protein